ncbi:MAG TPA: SPFH domain-containing protein [Bacteroidota bacterium]|nr:SPFH domain-containing protein [Bacteroidota bacterium]
MGNLIVPFMIILLALAFIIVLRVIASRYKKIPPNAVGIFYGRKYAYKDPATGKEQMLGFKVVGGGGRIILPFVESYQEMSTAAFQTEIDEKGIPNKDNVKINVKGVATCKISTVPEDLVNAAQSFLGKGEAEIKVFVQNILKGHLRSIIGKLDIDSLLRERDQFNRKVVEESAEELRRLGIQIITLVIQEVGDEYGYIDALGKRAVAEAVRDANIKVAEADRETAIRVSTAQREAATVRAANEASIAEAEMGRDIKKAEFKVKTDTRRAEADKALDIANADQEKTLRVKQADRDAAEREAQIKVQEMEAVRKQRELDASVVKQAEAERQKRVIDADAARQEKILQAEAEMQRLMKEAEGKKNADTLLGEGEAAKTRATLLALADGEAAKKKQALVAEAEGTVQLAAALAKMSTDAKLILVLDRLPLLFDRGGDALSKVATSVFSSVAAPFGSIDKIEIVDTGSGRGLEQLSSVVPGTVFRTVAAAKAQGIDISKMLKFLGVDIEEALKKLGDTEKAG